LYLRVHSNGRVEYEDGKLDGARSRFLVRRARLSASEINSLSDFLTSSGVKSLATEYPPVNTPVDHFIIVTIRLPRGRESQTIKIVNFFPMSPKDSEAYPTALVQLLCKIERLRNGASFGITADRTEWCYWFVGAVKYGCVGNSTTPRFSLGSTPRRLTGSWPLCQSAPLTLFRLNPEHHLNDGTLRLSPATTDITVVRKWLALAGGSLDGVVAKRLDLPYQPGTISP
jgi:hypothetical protein